MWMLTDNILQELPSSFGSLGNLKTLVLNNNPKLKQVLQQALHVTWIPEGAGPTFDTDIEIGNR
jgi:Leucine-rich repeat (LRR) protein